MSLDGESGSEGCLGGEEEDIDVKPIIIEWTTSTSPCSSSGGSETHLRCPRGGHLLNHTLTNGSDDNDQEDENEGEEMVEDDENEGSSFLLLFMIIKFQIEIIIIIKNCSIRSWWITF